MKRIWQIGNILSLVFALVANALVGAKLVGLPAIEDVSDKYATLLTPAGYAFSIWSLIYILLIGFVVYQARDLVKPDKKNDIAQKIGPLFIVSSIANGLWTFVFVNDYIGLSVAILLLLAASLYAILWRLRIAVYDAPLKVRAFVWWPLLIYTGWVTAATLVNISSWATSLGYVLSPAVASAVLVGLAACLVGLLILRNVRELLLATTWAIVAVGVQQMQPTGNDLVATTAFVVSMVLLVAVVVHAYTRRGK